MLTRTLALAGTAVLVGGLALIGSAPAHAAPAPVTLGLEIAGPDGVFAPVASGSQFAVSSITDTTARWTITNPSDTSQTGFYLYSYGPDCLVSDLTIAASSTYVCTEVIPATGTTGIRNLGALAGLFADGEDYPVAYPLVIHSVDDTDGQSFTISKTTVAAGGTLVISGTGFDEDDALTGILASDPVDLGSFTVVDGAFSSTLTLPVDLDPGMHTITLYSNGVAYAVRTFELLGGPALAATGVDATAPALVGAGLLGLGAVLVLRRRRVADFTG